MPHTPKASVYYTTSYAPAPRTRYAFHRLAFIKAEIEPLGDDEEFRVITPAGTFQMTKAQFYDTFHNVVATMSYRDRGLYHYPTLPSKALRFRIE